MTSWNRWGLAALLLFACAASVRATPMSATDPTPGVSTDLHDELVTSSSALTTPLDLTRTYTNTTGSEIDGLTIAFNVVSGNVSFTSGTDDPSNTFSSITVNPSNVTFAGATILPNQSVTVHVLGAESLPNTVSVSISGVPLQSGGESVPEPISLLIWGAGTAVIAAGGCGRRKK